MVSALSNKRRKDGSESILQHGEPSLSLYLLRIWSTRGFKTFQYIDHIWAFLIFHLIISAAVGPLCDPDHIRKLGKLQRRCPFGVSRCQPWQHGLLLINMVQGERTFGFSHTHTRVHVQFVHHSRSFHWIFGCLNSSRTKQSTPLSGEVKLMERHWPTTSIARPSLERISVCCSATWRL